MKNKANKLKQIFHLKNTLKYNIMVLLKIINSPNQFEA